MKKQHEPLPEDMPALTERLRALHDRPVEVPAELDEGILAAARAQLAAEDTPGERRFRLGHWSAVAAMLVLAAGAGFMMYSATKPHESPIGMKEALPTPGGFVQSPSKQGTTILSAFALAREAHAAGRKPDTEAIDALAYQAIALRPHRGDGAPAAQGHAGGVVKFTTVSITLDPGGKPLAAYQLRLAATTGWVKVVGVEAGEGKAFTAKPPYYDRTAEKQDTDELLLAMFTTAALDDLPRGAVRVATVHLMTRGDVPAKFEASLVLAADPQGDTIPAVLTIKEGN